jgi:hypothetical protein
MGTHLVAYESEISPECPPFQNLGQNADTKSAEVSEHTAPDTRSVAVSCMAVKCACLIVNVQTPHR